MPNEQVLKECFWGGSEYFLGEWGDPPFRAGRPTKTVPFENYSLNSENKIVIFVDLVLANLHFIKT